MWFSFMKARSTPMLSIFIVTILHKIKQHLPFNFSFKIPLSLGNRTEREAKLMLMLFSL